MDSAKKQAFVKAMGKGRQKFAKGGRIEKLSKRKYFDDGGVALTGPGTNGTNQNATNPNSGLLGTVNQGLGLNNNFQATSADIQNGTNTTQLNNAYNSAQNALGNQGNLVTSLTPGVTSAVNNQNQLANEYSAMAQGQGPNPAQAELAQSTGQNVAQTGAEMAGARGSSGNVGLMARQIGQQGAATQQQAAGQGATLEAQQQIAAQNNLANLANNQISQAGQATTGLNSAAQNEQSILQNANTSSNNANVGMQSNINNTNAQTSAANQNMASNTLGGIASLASSASSLFAKGGEVHHLKLAEMNAHALKHSEKIQRFDDGGDVDTPDLGTFKADDDSSSSPNIASSSSLPSDQTNLASSIHSPGGGGGGGGGGGMSSIMGLAAMMADGGPIVANPLLAQSQINGPGTWAQGYFNSGSSSSPNIAGSVSLPANKENFSKDVQDAMSKKGKKKDTESEGTATDWETGGGLAGDTMDNSAPVSPGADLASDAAPTEFAAQGGMMYNPRHFHEYFSEGGSVPAMVSPGEIYLSPDKVKRVIEEGIDPAKIGHKFQGKAKVKGDSLKNDIIPSTLQEGGVVIDRKNMGSKEKRELFVHRAIARKKARG